MAKTKPIEERFWPKVDKSGDCWLWIGTRFEFGYGQLMIEGKKRTTHRLSWIFANGPIPPGLCVLHRCDNPPCVNPAHLFLGTLADNNKDKHSKGRDAKGVTHFTRTKPERVARGERHGCAVLAVAQVREICRRRLAGEGLTPIASDYHVSITTVSHIARGRTWTSFTADIRAATGT